MTDQNITLNSSFHLLFWGGEYKNVEICYGGSPPPPPHKLDSTEKRESDTRSTSVNVLSSNLGQVGVRGYVMKRQQT